MKEVTAAIMRENEKFFIARRGPKEKLAGYWEFPGGKIDEGETAEECLRRELFEEFGVETRIGSFYCESRYCYGHGSIKLLCYHTEYISGEFLPTVHDQIKWVSIFELPNYEFAPADVPVVDKIISDYGF